MVSIENFDSATRFRFTKTRDVLSQRVEELADKIWRSKIELGLFDGDIFSVESTSSNIVNLKKSKYRYFIAQQEMPDLFDALQIRLLAVSGILICNDGIVFGKRSPSVLQNSNLWELLPSGSVNSKSFEKEMTLFNIDFQIEEELWEESGIPTNVRKQIQPKLTIGGGDSHVIDFVYEINVNLSSLEVFEFHKRATSEYSQLVVVGREEISEFVEGNEIVGTSKKIIEMYFK